MKPNLLDCGHPESDHSDFTTGYGKDAEGRKYCYACCTARDKDAMKADGQITAYLSSDGKTVTNWPGNTLATVMSEREGSAGGFAARTTVTRIWARAEDGSLWHGRGPGRGMYLRLRRSVTQR
jgi:hypothetical protein